MGVAKELADDDTSARSHNTAKLAQRPHLVWDLAEHGDQVRAVEAAVGVGQRARVAAPRLDVPRPLAGDVVEHLLLEVEDRERPHALRDGVRVVAGARPDLEQALRGPGLECLEQPRARDQRVRRLDPEALAIGTGRGVSAPIERGAEYRGDGQREQLAHGSQPTLRDMTETALDSLRERTRYLPGDVEPRVFRAWEDAGIFEPAAEGDGTYSIAIPPPNVTGALHMGHALNGSIQDALVRMKRMQGRRTKWIFGTDHAGIATQVKVEEQLRAEGTSREEIGREAFVERVWSWRERYGSQIVEQFKRLGASADYGDERFTMDPAYARAVTHVFVRLYEKGLIYRDNYIVNWDPGTRSAISDLEVEQRERRDTLYMIDYPLAGGSGSLTVATVRPETMLADTAIAVNPTDPRYTRLIGESAILPLVGRRLPIIADDYVDPEFGTGALKITPGHDPNDFEIGRRHGLDEITVIGEDGRDERERRRGFAGLAVEEARAGVVAALREQGLISGQQPYVHDVPHSHRSGRPIEPLISLQWFCDMEQLAAPALAAAREGALRFHPERPWTRVYEHWLEGIRPWCISRQLWWGHQLPVWYCEECGETWVGERAPERCGAAAPGRCAATRTCSTRGSRPRCGRSPRSAGPIRPRSSATSTRPTRSSPRATSSSSGSLGW